MEKNKEIMEKNNSYISNALDIQDALSEEMDGFTPTFEKVRIPAGGGLAYEIPGEDLESPDMAKEFKGVILFHHPINVYYKEKFDGSSNPPECSSMDGKTGFDNETGEIRDCSKCPLSKFGTAEDGKGKACKQKRRLYVLRAGEQFPLLLTLPTGSLSEFSKYIMRLLNRTKKSSHVVTKFSLKKAQNSTGINYSQAVFAVDRELAPDEKVHIEKMAGQIKSMANQVSVDEDNE